MSPPPQYQEGSRFTSLESGSSFAKFSFAKLGSSDLANSLLDWFPVNYIRFFEGVIPLWSSNSRVRAYVSKHTRSGTDWLSQIVVSNYVLITLA